MPQHWKSLSVPLFEDESNYGQPALREQLTNSLIAKFQRDNTLQLRERGSATVALSGKIISVEADLPIAVAEGTQASRLQVTIKASVTLNDNVYNRQVWNKTFSASGTYAPSGGTAERENGIHLALDKLTDDIVLETLSAW